MKSKSEIHDCRSELRAIADDIRNSSDINTLIDMNLGMRQRQFYIQEMESKAYSELINARGVREIFEKKTFKDNLTDMSANKAKMTANMESQSMRSLEDILEAEYNDWKGLRFTVDSFCDAAQQKIAALRKEHEVESMRQH